MSRGSAEQLDALADDLVTLTDDEIAELLDSCHPDDLALIDLAVSRQTPDPWRHDPATFAQYLDGDHFTRFRYVDVLAETVRKVVEGETTRAIIMMPARYGKTTSTSIWGPAWALDRYPWLQIVLASYGQELAAASSLAVRDIIDTHAAQLRVKVRRDKRATSRWHTTDGGMVRAVGVGSGLTGHGGDLIIIDDPFKDWKEAHSPTIRESVWNWYKSVVRTRLQTDTSGIIVVGCLTGDTLVLMADGTEKPISEVRGGDQIATYENGQLTTSTVRDWANQGPDPVFAIRMKSGVTVRANARHPFLSIEDGEETWRRTMELGPGSVILRATGASGAASPALPTDATSRPSARACACPTTTNTAGNPGTGPRHPTQSRTAEPTLNTAMGSTQPITTACSPSRTACAPSANNPRPPGTPERTGTGSSASTTATIRAESVGSCATTATSPLATGRHPRFSPRPPSTYEIEHDVVIDVVPAGIADVYDIEVDRTHNFVANGLVTHNTRWHEDDLVGRLLAPEDDSEKEDWHVVRMPVLAEEPDPHGKPWEKIPDPLGRKPGEPLEPLRFSIEAVHARIKSLGSYLSAGMEFQRPSSLEGGILKRAWWQYYGGRPDQWEVDDWLISWDASFDDTTTNSSYVVGQCWARKGSNKFLIDQVRDQMDYPTFRQAVVNFARKWPQAHRKLIENKANGPAVIKDLYGIVTGLTPREPKGSKESRAHAVSGDVEGGNVHLPDPGLNEIDTEVDRSFVHGFIDECALFPGGSHDDQVDAATQALLEWQGAETSDVSHYQRRAGGGRR